MVLHFPIGKERRIQTFKEIICSLRLFYIFPSHEECLRWHGWGWQQYGAPSAIAIEWRIATAEGSLGHLVELQCFEECSASNLSMLDRSLRYAHWVWHHEVYPFAGILLWNGSQTGSESSTILQSSDKPWRHRKWGRWFSTCILFLHVLEEWRAILAQDSGGGFRASWDLEHCQCQCHIGSPFWNCVQSHHRAAHMQDLVFHLPSMNVVTCRRTPRFRSTFFVFVFHGALRLSHRQSPCQSLSAPANGPRDAKDFGYVVNLWSLRVRKPADEDSMHQKDRQPQGGQHRKVQNIVPTCRGVIACYKL